MKLKLKPIESVDSADEIHAAQMPSKMGWAVGTDRSNVSESEAAPEPGLDRIFRNMLIGE